MNDSKGQCKDERTFRSSSSALKDYELMTIVYHVSTAQIHIPIPIRKLCKVYESLEFLQKTWLSNAKSTKGKKCTVTKFGQILQPKILLNTTKLIWPICPINTNIWDT